MSSLHKLALAGLFALLASGTSAQSRNEGVNLSPDTSLSGNYLAGRLAGSLRDSDAAAAYFAAALKEDPKNPELLERAFVWVLAEGKLDEAMRLADRVAQINPSNREARLALAIRAIKARQFLTARTQLDQAARGPLGDLTATLLSAWTSAGSGDSAKALQTIEKLRSAEWSAALRDFHAGLILDAAGKTADAKTRLDASYAADRSALRVVEALARNRSRGGTKEEALAPVAEFEAVLPRHPLIRQLRADIEAGTKLPPLVGDVREGAAEVLYGLAGALARQRGEDLAIIYLRLALHLDPTHNMAIITLADIYETLNQHARAIEVYEMLPAASPLKHNAEIQAALALDKLDRTEEAIKKLQAQIEADPKDYESILALGNIFRSRERFPEAAEAYSKAVDLVPQPTKAHWTLFYVRGIAFERSKQWDKAELDLKKALELSPDQPLVLNYLGYSWVDQGRNLDEGLEMIKKAVELQPDDGFIVDSLGWAYYRLGRFEEAVTELERAVELRPQDPVLNDHLGDAYWKVGRQLEAQFQWSHAKELKPEAAELVKIEAKLKNGLVETPTNAAGNTVSPPTAPAEGVPPAEKKNGG
jgi:tetratricopeptide (TPR) repeat protein